MRGKLLAKNTFSSLIFQITTIICGFVLPRLILKSYGSEVNGLVNSIVQFLQIIAFLELGVGAVVQSSLYKPLADKNNIEISKIVSSAEKFFRRIAVILLVYVVVLICVYPFIVNQDFGFIYTMTLIAAISISSFAQYYFGIVNRLLLTADQRGYVQYNSQTVVLILNTVACAILINLDSSIQLVKLTTSLIYLLRPLYLKFYVDKYYTIDRRILYKEEPIKQKWNGVAQHVAAIVLDGTANIVLTIFSTLSNVSIYSVYYLVVYGVKRLFISSTNGIQALLGELWAKRELDTLNRTFGWTEWFIHTGVTFVFGCTGILIVPFISVYTSGVNDANYLQPLFAVLVTIANAMHCLRLPYNIMILAGGHYKQTQHNYIIAVILNIVISISVVKIWGLVGVAIGMLIALVYQTVWMAYYDSRNLIRWPFKNFVTQVIVDGISIGIAVMATRWISLEEISYFSWLLMAIKVTVIMFLVVCVTNFIFYRDKINKLKNLIMKKCIKVK